jgi:hypothetical protein
MHLFFHLQKTVLAASFAALLVGPSLIYASDKHDEKPSQRRALVLDDPRPKYALFSWKAPYRAHRFALISNNHGSEEGRFINDFDFRRVLGVDIRELERRLSTLPRHCLVRWTRDEPHKLGYADPGVVRRLKKLASKLQLDLQFDETAYEDVGIGRNEKR